MMHCLSLCALYPCITHLGTATRLLGSPRFGKASESVEAPGWLADVILKRAAIPRSWSDKSTFAVKVPLPLSEERLKLLAGRTCQACGFNDKVVEDREEGQGERKKARVQVME